MSNQKHVKRYRFLRIWQIAENEAWFADMSEHGLHLHSIGSSFATFQQGEPTEYIYIIEPFLGKKYEEEEQEKLALYQDAGWEFVAQMEQLQVFRAPARAKVKGIHTDRSIYLELLQERKKKLFKSTLASLFMGILYIVFMLYRSAVIAAFFGPLFLLPILFIHPNLFHPLLDYYYLYRYIKRQHLVQQNSRDYLHAMRRRQFTLGMTWLVCLVILAAITYTGYQQKVTKPLNMAPAYVLTLDDVYEEVEDFTGYEGITNNEFSTINSLRFAAWTDYSHAATSKDGDFNVINGNVFLAKEIRAAQQMVRALIHHATSLTGFFDKIYDYTDQPQNPGFDELYLTENYTNKTGELVVRHGNYVYEIFFASDGQLILDALYRQVTQLP